MSKFVSLCATIAVAFAVTACGGSGSEAVDGASSVPPIAATPVIPTKPAATPADMTILKVPTDPAKTSVMPGQIGSEGLAVRVVTKKNTVPEPIEQLVFKVTSKEAVSALFKRVKFVDSNGNDVRFEAFYEMDFDDANAEFTVNFQYQWTPDTFSAVPRSYSVVIDIDPNAKAGSTYSLELVGIQTHNFAVRVAIQDVKSETFKVANVTGVDLPLVTTQSTALMTFPSVFVGGFVGFSSFHLLCPATNTEVCTPTQIRYEGFGTSQPSLFVDGNVYGSSFASYPDSGYVADISGVSLKPGETKTFIIFGVAFQETVQVSVTDIVVTVGPDQIKVSPREPSTLADCLLVVNNAKGCPKPQNTGKG